MRDLQEEATPAIGRVRRPKRGAERWRGVIRKLDASGLLVAAFCAAEGVGVPSVYHWRRKLRDDADADAAPARVVRLSVTPAHAPLGASSTPTRGLAVAELTSGDRVSVDACELPRLIAALRGAVPGSPAAGAAR